MFNLFTSYVEKISVIKVKHYIGINYKKIYIKELQINIYNC